MAVISFAVLVGKLMVDVKVTMDLELVGGRSAKASRCSLAVTAHGKRKQLNLAIIGIRVVIRVPVTFNDVDDDFSAQSRRRTMGGNCMKTTHSIRRHTLVSHELRSG